MGLRGPKPRSEFEKWLKGNPGKRRLNYPEAVAIAPDFTRIADTGYEALGWLQRAAARPEFTARSAKGPPAHSPAPAESGRGRRRSRAPKNPAS
jgi:hypothetical protein